MLTPRSAVSRLRGVTGRAAPVLPRPASTDLVWRLTAEADPLLQLRRLHGLLTGRRGEAALRAAAAGKRILVTGASAGIGRETARALGAAGAEMILVARRTELLDALAGEIRALGGVAHAYGCDLADDQQVDALAELVLERHGGVDILINNAGHSIRRTLARSTDRPHDFERVMRLNYFGAVRLTLPLLARMRRQGHGHVINVSTMATQFGPEPRFAAYIASKAALDAFARSAAPETLPDGVRWTTVHMPLVRTDMIAPTAAFRDVPAMSPSQGAQMILDAVIRRPVRVSHPIGVVSNVVDLVTPGTLERLMSRTFRPTGHRQVPTPQVAIVGAGMSGLCMALKLQDAGIGTYTIFEKAADLGGTWRDNTYPGLTCDVPAPYYAYAGEPNPGWSSLFAPGDEIWRYFDRVAAKHGLRERIRFGCEVTEARWEDGHWTLVTGDGQEHHADVLVSACGVLHHPRTPAIAGLETFAGPAFHSARWDHDVPLEGARVGVIGTGSSGVQIVTALTGVAGQVTLFQRTAQWILPMPNPAIPAPVRVALRRIPGLSGLVYAGFGASFDVFAQAPVRPGWQRTLVSGLVRRHLERVADPELRAELTPADEPMCKRLVASGGFYDAIQSQTAQLVTAPIDHVGPAGVVTADGTLHELDVLVLATGFDAQAYLRPLRLVGRDGLTLEDAWHPAPKAYRSVAIPGFPNFFMLMGPNSPIGNASLVAIAETQADYVVAWLRCLTTGQARAVAPTSEATERFNEAVRAAMSGTIWVSGCSSWYLGVDGIPTLWPWSLARFRAMLRTPELADFELDEPGRAEPARRTVAGRAEA